MFDDCWEWRRISIYDTKQKRAESLYKSGRAYPGILKFLDIVYPPRCPFCGNITNQKICDLCKMKIHYIKEPRCMKCGKPVETMEQEYCQDCAKQKHIFDQGRGLWIQKQPVSRSLSRPFHRSVRTVICLLFVRYSHHWYG